MIMGKNIVIIIIFAAIIALTGTVSILSLEGSVSSGVPTIDPFSYTMTSYTYVNHEWVHDIGLAYLYPFIGKYGFSLIYTAASIRFTRAPKESFAMSKSMLSAFRLSPKPWAIDRRRPGTFCAPGAPMW